MFVGAVVLAGALFRHHDPPRPARARPLPPPRRREDARGRTHLPRGPALVRRGASVLRHARPGGPPCTRPTGHHRRGSPRARRSLPGWAFWADGSVLIVSMRDRQFLRMAGRRATRGCWPTARTSPRSRSTTSWSTSTGHTFISQFGFDFHGAPGPAGPAAPRRSRRLGPGGERRAPDGERARHHRRRVDARLGRREHGQGPRRVRPRGRRDALERPPNVGQAGVSGRDLHRPRRRGLDHVAGRGTAPCGCSREAKSPTSSSSRGAARSPARSAARTVTRCSCARPRPEGEPERSSVERGAASRRSPSASQPR